MTVERVARAMTAGGPRAGFTARVMAPIFGRPSPGFTSRVMAALDAPESRSRVVRVRPVAAAAGGACAAIAALVLWLPGATAIPPIASAPDVGPARYAREAIGVPPLPHDRWAPTTKVVRAPARRHARVVEIELDPGDAYRIAPLSPADRIELRPIDDRVATVGPLTPPAALTIPDLRFQKEHP